MSNDVIEIARFTTSTEAALVQVRLDEAGIRSRLDGEAMATWFWHLGSAIGGVKLLVNRQDAELASTVLSSLPQIAETDSIRDHNNRDDEEDSEASDVSPELRRAFRASILGTFLFPPLLNIYSIYLLIRHRLYRVPRNWRVGSAISINLLVAAMVVFFWAMIIMLYEPQPTFFAPDGTPIELDSFEIPVRSDR